MMKAKGFLIVLCLFCAGVLPAQNSAFIQKWEQQARSRGASWGSYTSAATAANRPTYTSLFVNGKFVASFNNNSACQTKVKELVEIAENMYGKSATSQPSNGNSKKKQALRDLERKTGINTDALRNQLTQKRDEALAKSQQTGKQEALSKVEKSCQCRTQTNPKYDPNYNSNAAPYSFGTNDLFATGNTGAPQPNSPFGDSQTQIDNPLLDGRSARTPQPPPPGSQPNVSLNFDDSGQYAGGINMNWTSPTQKNVSYGEDLFQAKMQAFDASLEAEKREHERITALNPFELEALNRKKGALEGTLQEYKDLCKGVIDCPWEREINKISDEIDVLTKQIDGREEWLAQVGKMSETELTRQEQKYQKFVDMASMSDFCYKDAKSLPDPPAGWTEIKMDNSPLGRIMAEANSHDDAGFQCSLLYNEQTGKYVLAFRGTEFGRELIDDGVRADGFGSIWESEQTRLAKKTVDDLMILGKINKEDLELTGHSLGGGLAAEAAIEYHLTAYTFNPKGISDVTHEKIAQNNYNYNGIIHNVVATNDPIQKIQNGFSEYVAPAFNVAKDMTPLIHPAFSLMTKKTNPINVRPIGGFTTIKEAYGNGGEGHRIPFIRQALTLRHNDIVKQQNKQ